MCVEILFHQKKCVMEKVFKTRKVFEAMRFPKPIKDAFWRCWDDRIHNDMAVQVLMEKGEDFDPDNNTVIDYLLKNGATMKDEVVFVWICW